MPTARHKPLLLLLALLVLGGCSFVDKTNTIEEIAPVVLLYLDEGNDGSVKLSTIIPPLKEEKKSVITTSSNTLIEGRYLRNLKYYRETKGGQIRMIFFSEAMANRGLMSLLDTFLRDPEISSRVFLSVVSGDMIEYLNRQLQSGEEQIDLYLYKMFSHYEKQGQLTTSNLHEFLARMYSPYADPVLPYYAVANNELRYSGTALFRGDKMVGKIPLSDDVFFQMLREKRSVQKTVPLTEADVVLGSIKTERQIRFTDSFRKVHIDVILKGRVEEVPAGQKLGNLWELQEFERSLERRIQEKLEKVIDRTQSLCVDPFGLGMHTVGWKERPFTREQWDQRWPDLDVTIHVSLKLEHTGMLDSHADRDEDAARAPCVARQ
ncbi:Ger(x)C family spore germination protein [Brevibacillus borstelensis]|uniref:Ger(x)C family spore germination protein n=1 Tax=Brevibacillus TaxID=55080 RepID=UPI00203E773E|nr:Ger(x)C family spore germination protein [Brevibacillus borstelensis]MCM3561580.1 Ger(x)C family spore germination protein [Brevibacillus borstelensis]MCM3592153.1 Ger(x)C family spore germination protein [Brevibacillus borstelensis]MED1851205.1 Ger(x)C family spore germination protein [Brevibacillus borstelensis]